jgi:hypothetical protein
VRNAAITITLSLLISAGCVQRIGDHPIKEILPTSDSVRVNVPESAASTHRSVGDIADYYLITRKISRDLNYGAAWVLILVHTIVEYPATSVSGNVYTWGPWSEALDPAEWRLTVSENLDGSYDWSFDGRSKLELGTEFLTVISGNAVPGATPHHGRGNFLLDFDAAELVDPIDNDNHGVVEIVYDLEREAGAPATLDIAIATVETDEFGVDQPVSFDYSYADNADGSGDLQFQTHGDLDDEGSAVEDALIRSRWTADGPGRADVQVKNGDLGELVVTASECWDETFRRVYYADSEEWLPTEGDVADCAFADQDLPDA